MTKPRLRRFSHFPASQGTQPSDASKLLEASLATDSCGPSAQRLPLACSARQRHEHVSDAGSPMTLSIQRRLRRNLRLFAEEDWWYSSQKSACHSRASSLTPGTRPATSRQTDVITGAAIEWPQITKGHRAIYQVFTGASIVAVCLE